MPRYRCTASPAAYAHFVSCWSLPAVCAFLRWLGQFVFYNWQSAWGTVATVATVAGPPSQVESQSMQLHGARSARRDKHRTHSFTFDVIATALQVVGVVVVVLHSRLFIYSQIEFIFGASLASARTSNSHRWTQTVQVAQVAEISCQMSPLATATKEFTHGARMWQLQHSALENGDFFFSARVQFACVCHAICLCPHLGCSSCSSSVVRRCVGVNKRCALNQCDCPATTGTTTAQTTLATVTATSTTTTIADKQQELKALLAGLQHSKEYPDFVLLCSACQKYSIFSGFQ